MEYDMDNIKRFERQIIRKFIYEEIDLLNDKRITIGTKKDINQYDLTAIATLGIKINAFEDSLKRLEMI